MIRPPCCIAPCFVLLALTGCHSLGPGTVSRDRFDYGKAVRQSWEEQLLLNMVGLRYGRAPSFIDVTSIINQYSLEGAVNAGVGANTSITGSDTASLGAASRWTDRPTVTYSPVRGQEFTRNMLTPIPPSSLYGLVQSGWPPQLVFGLGARAINGVRHQSSRLMGERSFNPGYFEMLEAWDRIQQSYAIGVRKRVREDNSAYILTFSAGARDATIEADIQFIAKTLKLDAARAEFELVYGNQAQNDAEIAVMSSSVIDMMMMMCTFFEIPPEHIEEGRAFPGADPAQLHPSAPAIRVRYSSERPKDAFIAVQTKGYWFFIDDKDLASKRVFSVLLIFLSLAETSQGAAGPTVTISQ